MSASQNRKSPLITKNSPPGPGKQPSQKRSAWVLFFSFTIAIVLLYLSLRGLDWGIFWNTIKTGHYEFILLIIPILSFNYFVKALRWGILIRPAKTTPIPPIFWANMVGYLGNAYLPARAGELLRSAFLGQSSGLGTSFVLATALTERLLDVVALVLIGAISLLWQGNITPLLANAVRIMAIAGGVGLALMIAAPFQEALILRFIGRLPVPQKMISLISGQIARFLVGMRSLQNWRRLTLFIVLTLAVWLTDAFGSTIAARIISQTLNIGQAFVLLSALGLSSAIPSTPGSVGVYQFVAVIVLVPFGFSRAETLAFIIISQILNYIVISFWGLLGLWKINKSRLSSADA